MSAGPPKALSISASSERRPPAFSPIATTTSTRITPAATTAAIAIQLGPPANGASASRPM